MTTAPWPDVDASFADRLAARTPTPFRHGLAGDERLSLEAIALLGDELGPDAISAEKAAKPLVSDDAGATSNGCTLGRVLEIVHRVRPRRRGRAGP